jgi:hypothetical protein
MVGAREMRRLADQALEPGSVIAFEVDGELHEAISADTSAGYRRRYAEFLHAMANQAREEG